MAITFPYRPKFLNRVTYRIGFRLMKHQSCQTVHGFVRSTNRSNGLHIVHAVMRAIWGALAVVHAVPMLLIAFRSAMEPSLGSVGPFVMLVGVTAFFAAKACDARWVRTERPLFEFGVWAIAGALAHGDVPVPLASDETTLQVVAAAAALSAAVASKRLRSECVDRWKMFVFLVRAAFAQRRVGRARGNMSGVGGVFAEGPLATLLKWAARPPPVVA